MAAWQRALLATFLLLALAQLSGVQDGLNRRIGDVHAQWRASGQRVPFPSDLVVVAIDDRSVTQLGRVKYWSRARYGELLARLSQAKVVGFDILFTEPDRDPSGDRAFAAAMRRHGRVVVPFYQWKETRPVSAETQRQERALLERVAVSPRAGGLETVQPSTLEPPIPELLASAAALGFADVNADPDGVYRAPTLLKALPDGTPLPQFTVAIAALAAGSGPDGALKGAPAELSFGGRRVPLEGGSIRLRALARRGGGFLSGAGEATPTISFVDALTAKP